MVAHFEIAVTISFVLTALDFAPAASVDGEIEGAYRDAGGGDYPEREIGVDDGVEIVQKEAALIGGTAGVSFKVVFGERERAGPGREFSHDSPDEREEMQGCQDGTAAGEEGTEGNECEPEEMDGEDERCQESHEMSSGFMLFRLHT